MFTLCTYTVPPWQLGGREKEQERYAIYQPFSKDQSESMSLSSLPLPFSLCIMSSMIMFLGVGKCWLLQSCAYFSVDHCQYKQDHRSIPHTMIQKLVVSALPSAMTWTDEPWHLVPSEWLLFIAESSDLHGGCPWQHQCNFRGRILAECSNLQSQGSFQVEPWCKIKTKYSSKTTD